MQIFPAEFSDILTHCGLRMLHGNSRNLHSCFANRKSHFVLLTDVIDRKIAAACTKILDDRLYPHLRTEASKIPADSIKRMTTDYSEILCKTMHVKTAFLQRRTARAYQVAEDAGLLEMLLSRSFITFAEAITGFRLSQEVGCQVLCYEQGDYVGPHTDHYPEIEERKRGYLDLHIMFSNSAVDHQWLVYEERSHFSKILNINVQGGIAVYKLPFWHYTTPLIGKPGREHKARRWVLLGTFALARE